MPETMTPPENAIPPAPAPKPVTSFLTLWFDEEGALQVKTENISVYASIGILRAATMMFEQKMSFTQTGPVKPT